MTSPDPEIDSLIDALRSDLPERKHADRMRARLIGAGVIVGAGVAAPGTAAGASALGTGGFKAGVLAKATAIFGGSKIGLATVVVAASAAVPLATYVATDSTQKDSSGVLAQDGRRLRPETGDGSLQAQEDPMVMPEALVPAPPELVQPEPVAAATSAVRAGALPAKQSEARASERSPAVPPSSVAVFPALQNRSPESTLREETELVDWALSALRSGDTAGARALLGEHAQRFPNGALVRERERALERVKHAEMSSGRVGPR